MSNQRNDPSSLSLGRAIARAQGDAAFAKAEVEELKKTQPTKQATQDAELAGRTIRAQRRRANQMLADRTTTLDELNSIDPAILSTAQAEQLRLNRNDLLMAQEMSQSQMLQINSPAALQRFENWRQQAALNPMPIQDFAKNNYAPTPPTAYDRWLERQNSFEGRKAASQSLAREQSRNELLTRFEYQKQNPTKPQGRNIGGLKDLNES